MRTYLKRFRMNPPKAHFDFHGLGRRACRDLEGVFEASDPSGLELLSKELLAAKKIVSFGVGREGLMMEAIAMRLMHAGFKSYVVGEMVTPAVGPGDLFLVSAGPGHFPTVETLLKCGPRGGWPHGGNHCSAGACRTDAGGRFDPSARADDGRHSCRPKHSNDGHSLRGFSPVIWRFAGSPPSGAHKSKTGGHVHAIYQHEVKVPSRSHITPTKS